MKPYSAAVPDERGRVRVLLQEQAEREVAALGHGRVKYNQDHYSFSVGANTQGHISRYSLDPSINMNTLDTRINISGSYTTKREFEFNTTLTYAFYNGYAEGYGQPEWRWRVVSGRSTLASRYMTS